MRKPMLLACLKEGKKNAITRKSLVERLQVNDRELRKMIQELRNEGFPILSSADNAGYYLPDNGDTGEHECLEFIAQQKSRAMKCFESTKGIRKYLHTRNQEEIKEAS